MFKLMLFKKEFQFYNLGSWFKKGKINGG
jgi:hypothetical protein